MTGADLKKWVKSTGLSRDEAAAKLGVSITTLYSYYSRAELDKQTVLALKALGFVQGADQGRENIISNVAG